jgi:hypothetical protein
VATAHNTRSPAAIPDLLTVTAASPLSRNHYGLRSQWCGSGRAAKVRAHTATAVPGNLLRAIVLQHLDPMAAIPVDPVTAEATAAGAAVAIAAEEEVAAVAIPVEEATAARFASSTGFE